MPSFTFSFVNPEMSSTVQKHRFHSGNLNSEMACGQPKRVFYAGGMLLGFRVYSQDSQ